MCNVVTSLVGTLSAQSIVEGTISLWKNSRLPEGQGENKENTKIKSLLPYGKGEGAGRNFTHFVTFATFI